MKEMYKFKELKNLFEKYIMIERKNNDKKL